MLFHPEQIRIDGFRISLKVFEPDQELSWKGPILARLCVLFHGGMSETGLNGEADYAPSGVIYKPPEDRPHLRFSTEGARTLTVEVESARALMLRQVGFPVDRAFYKCSGLCTGLALRMYRELRQRDEVTPLVLEGLALELLGEAFRSERKVLKRNPPKWLAEVKTRIHDEFTSRLTLTHCARSAGVHPIHLAQSFRIHFGDSFGHYVRRLRIEFASRQILETKHTFADIALAAGFSDQSHFCRAFKLATGLSPKQYRSLLAHS